MPGGQALLSREDRAHLRTCLEAIREQARARPGDVDGRAYRSLQRSGRLASFADWNFAETWRLGAGAGQATLFVLQTQTVVVAGRRHTPRPRTVPHLVMVGALHHGLRAGRILVRRETLFDKVADFFGSEDVDFPEHPEFSRRYFVRAEDRARATRALARLPAEASAKAGARPLAHHERTTPDAEP